MWDAAGEESSDIAVSLEEAPGGYRYTITPDREWLAAAERLYPVTVDPTMSAPNNWSTIKDTTGVYNSSMGTLNTTAEKKTIKVGNRQGSEVVGLVYQPMPSLLNDTSRIIEASLVLLPESRRLSDLFRRRPDQRPSVSPVTGTPVISRKTGC